MSRRAAVLAALLLLAALPGTAHAGLKSMWGPSTLPDGRSAFPVYKDLGVDVLQYQVVWRRVAEVKPADPRNPSDPAYRWDPTLDAAVAAANAAGIKVALMVKDTPGWAKGGRPGALPPDRDSDYADFLVAVAKRYPRVRHWMIWGEPSRSFNWSSFPKHSPEAPRRYATLLDRSYGTLKKLSRRNVVIGGMTFTVGDVTAPEWVRWMRLPNGKPPRLDWYGHNAFSGRRPSLANPVYVQGVRDFSDLDTLRREVNRAYRKRKQRPRIWVSEFAVSSDRPNRAFSFYVSRQEQAAYVREAYRIARRHKWIAGVGWYGLADETDPKRGLTTGLLTARGERKPAYTAYKRAR